MLLPPIVNFRAWLSSLPRTYMDGSEVMEPYYTQRGGAAALGTTTDSGLQSGLQTPASARPLSSPLLQVQPSMGLGDRYSASTHTVGSSFPPSALDGCAATSAIQSDQVRKKRGRPRKYGLDGTVSLQLSPFSCSLPASGSATATQKRRRGRPPGTGRKQQLASLGELFSGSAGNGFIPHIVTIPIGEDIAARIMSFSQQGPRAVCIISANGSVSTVTLCQPAASGGTVTYEGRFEILCLSGSYSFTDAGESARRTGGLSISLSSPDGRVIGGGVGGTLIAASQVQIVVGSFIYRGKKLKGKAGSNPEPGIKAEQPVEESPMLTGKPPSPTATLMMGEWTGARPIDAKDEPVDIDLTC